MLDGFRDVLHHIACAEHIIFSRPHSPGSHTRSRRNWNMVRRLYAGVRITRGLYAGVWTTRGLYAGVCTTRGLYRGVWTTRGLRAGVWTTFAYEVEIILY